MSLVRLKNDYKQHVNVVQTAVMAGQKEDSQHFLPFTDEIAAKPTTKVMNKLPADVQNTKDNILICVNFELLDCSLFFNSTVTFKIKTVWTLASARRY